ncbi:hypothetical protein D9K81_18140 [Acinetobacter chengduensis]|jgi:hypothetical protein|uniref:Uncharacterized protein n=1 Tax=Acinetobacter chengduensis TaxID=2420890 RepID=A0ABX9TRD8_9GAMM|nr:hypothetical protein D7V31_17225 [Acinetobacter sp. WCHAc060007]RLL16527.1 hypothetical protein D9K81_18140 [Acinetobacter chengduensis]
MLVQSLIFIISGKIWIYKKENPPWWWVGRSSKMNRSQEDIKMELTLALIKSGMQDPESINQAVNSMYINVIKRTQPS